MKLFSKLLVVALFCFGAKATPIEINTKNSMPFFGPIHELSGFMFFMNYNAIRKTYKGDLYLVLHSNGGMVDPAEAIIEVVRKDPKLHVVIIWAASAAAAISQNVGGKTFIVPKGYLLFHEVRTMVLDDYITQDDAADIAQGLAKANAKFARLCNAKMKLPTYSKRVKNKDWVLDAKEAQSVRAAKIEEFTCSEELRQLNVTVPVYNYITGQPTAENICNLLN